MALLLEGFQALLIDDQTQRRLRLKQVLSNMTFKCKIDQARSEHEAFSMIERASRPLQCIIVSTSVASEGIANLLAQIKGFKNAKKSIFIVCLGSEHKKGSDVAKIFLDGADGFIFEPFAAQEIQDHILLMYEKKSQQISTVAKNQQALDILFADARHLINSAAMALSQGESALSERKAIRDVGASGRKAIEGLEVAEIEKILLARFKSEAVRKGYVPRKQVKIKVEEALHPGIVVQRAMQSQKFSEEKIRANLKIDPEALDALLKGEGMIDEFIARELARVLGRGSAFWLDSQKKYDKYLETKPKDNS